MATNAPACSATGIKVDKKAETEEVVWVGSCVAVFDFDLSVDINDKTY